MVFTPGFLFLEWRDAPGLILTALESLPSKETSWLATISPTQHTLVGHTDIWLRTNEPHLGDSGNPFAGPCSTSATNHPAWEWVRASALACRQGKDAGSDGTCLTGYWDSEKGGGNLCAIVRLQFQIQLGTKKYRHNYEQPDKIY